MITLTAKVAPGLDLDLDTKGAWVGTWTRTARAFDLICFAPLVWLCGVYRPAEALCFRPWCRLQHSVVRYLLEIPDMYRRRHHGQVEYVRWWRLRVSIRALLGSVPVSAFLAAAVASPCW